MIMPRISILYPTKCGVPPKCTEADLARIFESVDRACTLWLRRKGLMHDAPRSFFRRKEAARRERR